MVEANKVHKTIENEVFYTPDYLKIKYFNKKAIRYLHIESLHQSHDQEHTQLKLTTDEHTRTFHYSSYTPLTHYCCNTQNNSLPQVYTV